MTQGLIIGLRVGVVAQKNKVITEVGTSAAHVEMTRKLNDLKKEVFLRLLLHVNVITLT